MAQRKPTSSKPRRVPNTAQLTEDDADYLISEKRLREDPEGISLEEYLEQRGLTMERTPHSSRSKRTR